jgi:hypothetical protein
MGRGECGSQTVFYLDKMTAVVTAAAAAAAV